MSNTRVPGFYRLSPKERFDIVTEGRNLTDDQLKHLSGEIHFRWI